jgi:hypothetical protein
MNSPSPEFHKIWIDQCAATEGIRESFGLKDAQDYLIGQKLFTFLWYCDRSSRLNSVRFRQLLQKARGNPRGGSSAAF